MNCTHENTEYDPGNYVPPYGWELLPGLFCVDCGEAVDEDEVTYERDPDLDNQYEKENSL